MKRPLIKCECCNGTGKEEIADHLWRTLKQIMARKVPTSRAELEEAGITPNAINNRLIWLEKRGLIKRVGKRSKLILWEAVKV